MSCLRTYYRAVKIGRTGYRAVVPVFIQEHLSPQNKALHAAVRIRAKEKGYKYVWVRSGKIFVRKSEDSGYLFIRNMVDLNKLA
ncbi:unnamed protein product [Euphydryas editha]|uniref:FP protein C-terminal domain-containing protein n=1 Tax=Euphydryas editha TaxID=104508 RepID=A0AAU9TUE1_EUPED|nr:unnamed protein product [Euphydryas editha]